MMGERTRLPDEAMVVRCGLPPFENSPLDKGCRRHPDGPYGFSIQAAPRMTVEDLAKACPNASVGYTTVGRIREMGYEVLGTGDPHHATVVVPETWTSSEAVKLARLFQRAINPNPARRQ